MAGTDNGDFGCWRDGNRFELLVDGGVFLPTMLDAIGQARQRILLELYLMESGRTADRFIEALTTAARRGVAVHLLLDDFGSHGLRTADRQRLVDAGVELCFYNPIRPGKRRRNLFRDHRKLLLIDNHTAFTGGFGITDEFNPETSPAPWRETAVRIEGEVLHDWQQVFLRNHARWSQRPLALLPATPRGDMRGRVAESVSLQRSTIRRHLRRSIRRARRRVWIATAYFIPSRRLRRALAHAARRGLDVRLLLPGPLTDHPAVRHAGRRFYTRLLRAGVRIHEYQPRFTHQKVALCDDWVVIGSSNLDRWNLRWNLEASQEILDAGFASQVADMFEHDLAESREILLERWLARPAHERFAEWFFGSLDLLSERWLGR